MSVLPKRAFTLKEFGTAHSLGITKTRELIDEGKLQAVRVGRKVLITAEAAESWLASLTASSSKKAA